MEKTESKAQRLKLLNYQIEEAGKNLSMGQKQLICIARALIRKPKILLMDEATSNIDQMTDQLIQKVIKENFGDTTIRKAIQITNFKKQLSNMYINIIQPDFI